MDIYNQFSILICLMVTIGSDFHINVQICTKIPRNDPTPIPHRNSEQYFVSIT